MFEDLGSHQLVVLAFSQLHQRRLRHFVQGLAVLLGEGQEEHLPGHREIRLDLLEGEQVLRQRSEHSPRQGVVLVQESVEVVDRGR